MEWVESQLLINKYEVMKLIIYISIACSLLIFSCHNKENPHSSYSPSNQVDSVDQKVMQDKVIVGKNLSMDQISELEEKSRIDAFIAKVEGNKILIRSDGQLTNFFLGNELTLENLNERFNYMLSEEIQHYDLMGTKQEVIKYTFKNSFFKVFHYKETNKTYLVCGRLVDEGFKSALNLSIGMKKDEFFSKLFYGLSIYDFSSIDTVENVSSDGGMNQKFVLDNHSLKEIIITTNMDWIDFEIDNP